MREEGIYIWLVVVSDEKEHERNEGVTRKRGRGRKEGGNKEDQPSRARVKPEGSSRQRREERKAVALPTDDVCW